MTERTAVISTAATVAAALVSILAWRWPTQPTADATPPPPPPPSSGTSQPGGSTPGQSGETAQPPSSSSGPAVHLADLSPQIGQDRLVEIPLAVRERADYNSHAIAIRCPSNTGTEPVTEVTYLLSRHYRQFDATVHPYYPPGSDVQSATWVTVLRSDVQRDGSLTTSEAAAQKRARPGAPGALTAVVEKADKLTVRVECDDPAGVVMLTDARLTPA